MKVGNRLLLAILCLPCPITSDFWAILETPTYPKIGRHLWTFPIRLFPTAELTMNVKPFVDVRLLKLTEKD